MNAIRQFIEVKDHSFYVSLPKDFNAKSVEIIIIPNENEDFFEVSEEQKKVLDKALEQDKKTFISRDDITRKYNL
ncbi:hypothetical protein V8245_00905 [Flavobacterium columnare]|uniref:Uncharacterized protein n=1 Tax=Flavobacterium indicum (strain DSM 17447 / CIP 109464 / GPTSA100-9) TaxID=1094466 RepID=H8XST8_FLAIG|nr:hypothetical protein [Flavobacterium indicum]CCG53480.1 Protein of unknown function [Flavobacterium indicum GPTSA100-9 = DSM 17447]